MLKLQTQNVRVFLQEKEGPTCFKLLIIVCVLFSLNPIFTCKRLRRPVSWIGHISPLPPDSHHSPALIVNNGRLLFIFNLILNTIILHFCSSVIVFSTWASVKVRKKIQPSVSKLSCSKVQFIVRRQQATFRWPYSIVGTVVASAQLCPKASDKKMCVLQYI